MNWDYEAKMKEYHVLLKWTPKEMTDLYIEILSFLKYHENMNFMKEFRPTSDFHLKIADAKHSWNLNAIEFMIWLFRGAYPENYTPIDQILWKPVKEVQDILSRDYELRKKEGAAIIAKLDKEVKESVIEPQSENN